MNADKYFDDYNFQPIMEKILKEFDVQIGEPSYDRHMQELKAKAEEIRKAYKSKKYFQDLPTLDDDFSSYVQIINTPFVEEAKREKFKTFLNKKLTANFKDKIKDYIFPYTDKDKDKLKDGGILMLQFDSNEEAKLAANALNGAQIDKSHKAIAVAYLDYDKIISMEDKLVLPNHVSFLKEIKWEESNLEEMMYLRGKKELSVGKIHYLKKELNINYSIEDENINTIDWSPQGRYLITTEENKITFFNGENSKPDYVFDIHTKDYIISKDEKYLITFMGYTDAPKEGEKLQRENVFIRDIHKNELIRGLAIDKEENFKNIKWSPDSAYFGRIKKDILIVYEAPKMQIILDPSINKRHPIKDNIKSFSWFPNRNNLIAITEKYNQKKLSETILHFIEIPSRKTFSPASLANLQVISFEWHKSNNILAVLCKSVNKFQWFVRVFQFNNETLTVKYTNCNLPGYTQECPYYDMEIKWLNDDLFAVGKYKENNLETINVIPYKFDRKALKIEQWPAENWLKSLKHSHFLPSSNGIHFLLACLDSANSNSYGKVDLYAMFDNKINFCKGMEFGAGAENISWDEGGRLFAVEITKKKENDGLKIMDSQGNFVYEYKDPLLTKAVWRPRHFPVIEKSTEYENIKKDFEKVKVQYENEDFEFLSEIEKNKKAIDNEKRNKFMGIVNKRRKKWEENGSKRKEIDNKENKKENIKENEEKVEHEFWIEEIIKTEETVTESADF